MKRIIMTVCHVVSGNRILLGCKQVRIGKGLWNGFGGHVEPRETIEMAAARELTEECGLVQHDMKKCGIVLVTKEGSNTAIELHFFMVTNFGGAIRNSDEMIPQWFRLDAIPYGEMWASDRFTLPLFLSGKKCVAQFHLADEKTILAQQIEEVEELPERFDEVRL